MDFVKNNFLICREWVGIALAALFIWLVAKMVRARLQRLDIKCNEIVVCTASDQSTIESIVSAQRGMQTVQEMMQIANVSILKLWSIYISKARKVFIYAAKLYLHFYNSL